MERLHVATFRRESGSKTRDADTGKVSDGVEDLATDVPCIFQPSGRMVPGPAGKDIQINATLFVSAADLPAGVELQANDHVTLTAGRRAHSLYRVHSAELADTRDGYFDDELLLVDTLQELTSA